MQQRDMSNQVLTIIKPGYTTTISKPDFLATIPDAMRFGSDQMKVILDPNQDIAGNNGSSFVVRVSGDGMVASGIHDGDQLIVDRTACVEHSNIVVAVIKGEFTVRRVRKESGRTWLMPENDKYPMLEITSNDSAEIWGVVTSVIHPVL
jgi:DNA polymerase V